MSWQGYRPIPKGYRKVEYGEPMLSDDLIWKWDKDMTHERWELMGECEETKVAYPYNISYRPMIRKDDD